MEEESGPKPEDSGGAETSSAGTSSADTTGGGGGGSCVGNCGNAIDQGDGTFCFCDPVCASAGDCCSDYERECPGQCLYNSDCDGTDVCSASSQECVPPYFHTYDVRVTYWKDGTCCCWDGGANSECLADVYFKAIYGGVEVYGPSATINNVLETGWFEESFEIDIDDIKGMSVLFYDNDTLGDTYLNGVCSGAAVCGAVTETNLHDGYTEWNLLNDPDDSKQYHVIVTYTAK